MHWLQGDLNLRILMRPPVALAEKASVFEDLVNALANDVLYVIESVFPISE